MRRTQGETEEAETLFREALDVYESLGDKQGIARTVDRLGLNLVVAGDDDRGRAFFERSLELFRDLGDEHGVALALYGLSVCRLPGADGVAQAQSQAAESVEILQAVGDRRTFAKVLWNVAGINAELGNAETAAAQLAESLTLFLEFGDRWFCVVVLEAAAFLAAATGDTARAVRLLGAADTVLRGIGVPLLARYRERHDRVLGGAHRRLGQSRFDALWVEGGRIPLGSAVEIVAPAQASAATDAPEGLTGRELEVLALVAEGRSDAEVAERLVVSLRTVHSHLRTIYRKLGVHTRTAATRYAIEHDLVPR